ncbi:hypothetical protein TrRE_jg9979 [Triparma retinervis]|uniref:Uncharacterized protein n=1 Tax=Triparma retinervis TaxID=2557542 RepID=A0A9W7KSQ4_9STRA|nr:hypothetical protein TrRE_jg9979 [Triparma retinervis]
MSSLEEAITSVDMDSPAGVDLDSLTDMIEKGSAFGVSEESLAIGRSCVRELLLVRRLSSQVSDLKANSPCVTQTLFCRYVNGLKATAGEVGDLLKEQAEGAEEGAPAEGALPKMLAEATEMCQTAHSEYWLCVATNGVRNIERAGEEHVKAMGRLKESITKAEMNEGNEGLIEAARTVHMRLAAELEVGRAVEGFPAVKLPVDTSAMTAKEVKEYWVEEDPEKPVNTGHVEETREWPKPPEDTGEYVWCPSQAYAGFKQAYDRLGAALEAAKGSGGNAELVEEGEKVREVRGGEMELMEGKNEEDKKAAVTAAEKLAKKLGKKGKKKK